MYHTAMKTTQLGQTGLEVTRLGFGAWALGGGNWEFGWGPQDDDESIAAIHHALDQGINWIDTAAAYGFGRSEEVVGKAISGLARKPYVFTKCSLLEGPGRKVVHSLKRDSLLREAEASLTRLGVDAIDLYQIHWPIPVEDIEEGWAALAELKEQGLVRHIGVSNFDVDQLRQVQQIAPVETLQPQYSLIERDIEQAVPDKSTPLVLYCGGGFRSVFRRLGGYSGELVPDPIPNSAVKLPSADGTKSQDLEE